MNDMSDLLKRKLAVLTGVDVDSLPAEDRPAILQKRQYQVPLLEELLREYQAMRVEEEIRHPHTLGGE